jgi:hypothetical protein
MLALANPAHYIRRIPTCGLVIGDFVVFAVGVVSFFMFIFKETWRRQHASGMSYPLIPDHDPYRGEKDMWGPWYVWLQLTAAIMHFLYMIMHCIDACRR